MRRSESFLMHFKRKKIKFVRIYHFDVLLNDNINHSSKIVKNPETKRYRYSLYCFNDYGNSVEGFYRYLGKAVD
jgi:hypothetical protein